MGGSVFPCLPDAAHEKFLVLKILLAALFLGLKWKTKSDPIQ